MIDGKPAEVERADFALTAIFVPEGRHEIVVTYLPPGLVPAAAVSALTAAAMLVFALFIAARQSGNARRKPGTGFSDAVSGALGRSAAQSSESETGC